LKAESEDFTEKPKFCALCNMITNHLGGKKNLNMFFSTGKKRTISKLKNSNAEKTT
jgi:hypothetical protein